MTFFMTGLIVSMLSSCSDNDNQEKQDIPEVRVSVHAVKAETGFIQSWVFAEGTARSSAREYLVFQNSGKITFLDSNLREGKFVKKGALLAQQDQRSLQADLIEARKSVDVSQAELGQAETQADLADKTFKRFEVLLQQDSASPQEYDEAKAKAETARADVLRAQNNISVANARLDQMNVKIEESELRAPMDGMVAYLNVEKGYYFTPSVVRTDSEEAALQTVPIVMIDPANFEIHVDVPVYDRNRVKVGQTVLIQIKQNQTQLQPSTKDTAHSKDNLLQHRIGQIPPDQIDNPYYIRGEVYSVNPAVSPSGRSIQVAIRTSADKLPLKDGMYVTVWIATEHKENIVTAPLETILFRDNQPFVFVVNEKNGGVAELRKVSLGLQGFDKREVISGIKPGEMLVTEGRYQLSNGISLRILGESNSRIPNKRAATENE